MYTKITRYLTYLSFFLLGFIIFSVIDRYDTSDQISIITENSNNDIKYLSTLMREQMRSSGHHIGLKNYLLSDSIKRVFNEKLSKNSLLAVRLSPLSCSMCVDSTLNMVVKFIENNKLSNRIVILTSYTNPRDLILFYRLHQIEYNVFNIEENEITLPVEHLKVPYMFIIDKDFVAHNTFIPEKSFPNITDTYLNEVIRPILLDTIVN